jgi:Ca-activated chloride channel family protein
VVKNYRLIGFDNKVKVMSDSMNEVQGGEVGSGHSLLALFEITPRNPDSTGPSSNKSLLGQVVLNYKLPHDSLERTSRYECANQMTAFRDLQPCYRFASSIALFGGLLKRSRFMGQAGWKDAIQMAEQSRDPADGMQEEFIGLIEKARKIYGRDKHHRKLEE